MKEMLIESLNRVEMWVERHDYKGYEPFDGLSSVLLPLTFGSVIGERLLQQLVRQSPLNLRPLFGVPMLESTKGRGYMAWGYLNRFQQTQDEVYKEKALDCLEWLDMNKSPLYATHSWGNHFPYASRSGRIPKHESTIVWTSLIGQAYLLAYKLFAEPRHLEIINSICSWILALPRERTNGGTCISYVTYTQSSVHNANMLGAAFLAKAAKLTGNAEALELAQQAMTYSCSRQLPDGAWYYGDHPMYHWVDNFHTGYNLDSLKRYIEASEDYRFSDNLRKGYSYFKENFFESTGRPKYYHNRVYPLDIQCASQAIDTLTYFTDYDADSLDMACRVARWTIAHMQDNDGHFYYRLYPFGVKAKAPMIHWAQATMYKALSHLVLRIRSSAR